MNASEYLDVAETLLSLDTEGALRSAVSRAYYAVFHAASDAQSKLGGQKQHSHEVLGNRLQGAVHHELRALGSRFLSLKTQRQRADYRFERRYAAESARAVVLEARELFGSFRELPVGHLQEEAREAIRAYDARLRAR